MKVCILCGGSGSRLREETEFKPKPMIHIGGKPMLWHIMKLYSHFGFNEFVLALGYKQEIIKDYFIHYDEINNDIITNTGVYRGNPFHHFTESWKIVMSDTGENTFKGARLKRVQKYLPDDTFMCTYGDGIANVDILDLVAFHKSHGKIVTVTGVRPAPRFGELCLEGNQCVSFTEKSQEANCWVNGGFFVFEKDIFNYLSDVDWCDLEVGPLEILAAKGELMVYKHRGFWGCMDTIRDMAYLDQLWKGGNAPWKIW